MPKTAPFPAIRYASQADLNAVIAPPYDVLSADDVAALAARDPHNIVHIDVPTRTTEGYDQAAQTLRDWLAQGVLVGDDTASLTIYRMQFRDATGSERTISGVLTGLEVVDLDAGGVLPHERTTPKAVTDRLDLTRATATNTSPVWGLSLAEGLSAALAEPAEPMGQLIVDSVVHSVERISDPARIAAITELLASDDVLIADGHHRYSISRSYRDEVRAATGRSDTAAEFTLAFINELIEDQLSIEAIHRVYTGVDLAALREHLDRCFVIEPAPAPSPSMLSQMVERGCLVLLSPDGSAQWLTPKAEAFAGVRELDGAYLEHALAGLDATVTYQHGLIETQQLVRSGEASAAILIRPTSLTEIRRTAREGLLMPPKSTFFTPKLRTGLVMRPTAELASSEGPQ